MGKYNINYTNEKTTELQHIANELAEANRLKRIELEISAKNFGWSYIIKNEFKTDIEDRA